jgi:hypothetical protein
MDLHPYDTTRHDNQELSEYIKSTTWGIVILEILAWQKKKKTTLFYRQIIQNTFNELFHPFQMHWSFRLSIFM